MKYIQCWNVGFFLHYRYYKSYRDAMLEGNKKEDAKCEKEKKKAVCDFSLWTKVLECGRFSEDFFVKHVLQCLCLRYDIWNCGSHKRNCGFCTWKTNKRCIKSKSSIYSFSHWQSLWLVESVHLNETQYKHIKGKQDKSYVYVDLFRME